MLGCSTERDPEKRGLGVEKGRLLLFDVMVMFWQGASGNKYRETVSGLWCVFRIRSLVAMVPIDTRCAARSTWPCHCQYGLDAFMT